MTAAAMILGMLPMALALGEGGEQNAPLGRAVIGGLLGATATTLFVVPIIYSYLREKPPANQERRLEAEEAAEVEEELSRLVPELVSAGSSKILLNLKGVKYIDSSGIGELIANYTTVGRGGGQLKLLNLTDKVQDLLVITKLLTVFDVYEEEADALSSFK